MTSGKSNGLRLVRCKECRQVYGSAWGPVKRGRYVYYGGRSGSHLCPGKPTKLAAEWWSRY